VKLRLHRRAIADEVLALIQRFPLTFRVATMRWPLLIVLLAACKGEPAPAASREAAGATHVTLPTAGDAPVRPTSKPLGRGQLARLAAIEHADFARQDRGGSATAIEVRHITRTRPVLGVTVQIASCGPCSPIDSSAQHRAQIRAELPPTLRDRPETRVELATEQIAGMTALASYQLGAAFGSDPHGQPAGDYVDAYALDYNDGVNRIRVTASYLDDAVGGVDRLLAIAPPEDLEKLAVAFLSFYLHAWQ
jgi:hypothetical protein